MSTATHLRSIRDAVASVPDPELPAVTIGMLGMIHDVQVADDGHVTVELLPTYSGCPAIAMIERDVADAVAALPGVAQVSVRFRFDPPWSPNRIDATGRERLRGFGIAPPGGPLPDPVRADGRPTLPIAPSAPAEPGAPSRPDEPMAGPNEPLAGPDEPRTCPYCGSDDTTRDSIYGPTPCRDVRFCAACRQPFEAFRSA